MVNKSRLAKSEVCQKCGNCCKEFYWAEYNRDWALRLMLLNNPKIVVEEKNLNGGIVWLIRIRHPCSKLGYKDGKYFCEIYDGNRPDFCGTYPDNIPMTDWDMHPCPLLKRESD